MSIGIHFDDDETPCPWLDDSPMGISSSMKEDIYWDNLKKEEEAYRNKNQDLKK